MTSGAPIEDLLASEGETNPGTGRHAGLVVLVKRWLLPAVCIGQKLFFLGTDDAAPGRDKGIT